MRAILLLLFATMFICSCSNDIENEKKENEGHKEEKYYVNPVLKPGVYNGQNISTLADPFVFKDGSGKYYLYVTGKGFHCFTSTDLVNWGYVGKCFDGAGVKWAKFNFWAPEVIRYNGKYYLHYTASETEYSPKRIGLAVSDSPSGPFVDISNKPFYQHEVDKGCIDSHIFIDDDNSLYMYYSNAMSENNYDGDKKRSEIWVVKLKKDLSGTEGQARMLIFPEQDWEYKPQKKQFWNEGALILKNKGVYYLMYSANNYGTSEYAVGYATSDTPMGPFVKYANNPILSNRGVENFVSGPGHNSVTESPDGTELICVYHSHYDLIEKGGVRMINIDKMGFNEDGSLYIDGPSYTKKKVPSTDNK